MACRLLGRCPARLCRNFGASPHSPASDGHSRIELLGDTRPLRSDVAEIECPLCVCCDAKTRQRSVWLTARRSTGDAILILNSRGSRSKVFSGQDRFENCECVSPDYGKRFSPASMDCFARNSALRAALDPVTDDLLFDIVINPCGVRAHRARQPRTHCAPAHRHLSPLPAPV